MSNVYRQWVDGNATYAVPQWGNCLLGCPPAYIDQFGFCSPACHHGDPRGDLETRPKDTGQRPLAFGRTVKVPLGTKVTITP